MRQSCAPSADCLGPPGLASVSCTKINLIVVAAAPRRCCFAGRLGFEYGSSMSVRPRSRVSARAFVACMGCLHAALSGHYALGADAPAGAVAITCTNPVSGASWQITIDYGKATVDFQPARVSQAEISWFDPKDLSNNRLDRKTGNLTTSIASSTGGYFRPGRCNLEK